MSRHALRAPFFAAIIALAPLVPSALTAQCKKPGVSRWAVKTSLPTKRNKPVALTLAEMVSSPAR